MPEPIPFTRATTATRTNAAGLIELAPYNLLPSSEAFSGWNLQNVTISSNTTTAPNGTLTADKLIPNTTSAQHRIFNQTSFLGDGVLSVYAKADGYNFLSLGASGGVAGATIIFNLANGTISGTASGFTPAIENVGNGWYRCSILNSTMGSGGNISYWIIARNANSAADYVGDDVSGILIWGAQLVQGTAALPYLKTETRLNIPRVDFSLGGCPNLLLEPQRTNLALQSSSFDSATWTKITTAITPNSTISPSGIVDADTYTGNGASSQKFLFQNASTTSGTTYTLSVYAKKNTNNFLQIAGESATFGVNVWANFNLDTGVVGTVGSLTTARIENVGNGWYRCSITGAATATTTAAAFVMLLVNSATSIRYETNTLSTSVFLWGAQLEAGAYPTTLIPTLATSVTRNADSFTESNVFSRGMITDAGGTWFVEIRGNVPVVRDLSTSGIFLNTGVTSTIGNGFVLRNAGSTVSRMGIFTVVAGALSSNLYTTPTDNAKIAFKWNGTTADVFVNGVKVVNATPFTPTAMQNLIAEGANRAVYINQMELFPTPLSDGELISMTTL